MRQLGKYIDLQLIGSGASACVYRGMHRELKAWRALKVFAPGSWQSRRRLDEAMYQARVEHPGIVQVMDIERDPRHRQLYLVMEYAPHGTLRQRLEPGPLEAEEVCHLAGQMARALAAAHAKGVWHLDLKPENVLFFAPHKIKIGDFGLARTSRHSPQQEPVVGTPGYMAPEQFEGRHGPASDLWALGAIIHEMLTGRACFAGQSVADVHSAMQAGPPPLPPEVDLRLARLVGDLLQYSAARRPASADEVAQALEAIPPAPEPAGHNLRPTVQVENYCQQCGRQIPLGRRRCPECDQPDLQLPAITTPPPPPPRRTLARMARPLLTIALGLAVAGGLSWFWTPGGSPPEQPQTSAATTTVIAPPPPTTPSEIVSASRPAPAMPAPRSPAPRAAAPPTAGAAAAKAAAGARRSPALRHRTSRAAAVLHPLDQARRPGQARLAVAAFKRHLAEHPDHLGARRNLALLYLELGDRRSAEGQLKTILRSRPRDVDAASLLELIRRMGR